MLIPILATKLYIPPPRPKVVLRSRLIDRLNEGLATSPMPSVTLISAPVGYGKTTLVSEWIACCGRPTAWLSLDGGDSDPTRFLTYLIAALQTLQKDLGAEVLTLLQASQVLPIESVLTALLNEITAFQHEFTLVLDDYHLIDSIPVDASKSVDDVLTFLIEHLPSQIHLVITTREDPQLPLARLRAQGRLTELRASDLRFTPAEAADFLNQVMGLSLSEEDIAALDQRTEGWIAGLQLAALSMRGREDVHGFIRSFAGDDRYIVDYLVEEVLRRQSKSVRSFLLQTSILDRLNGSLCDAVCSYAATSSIGTSTGQADSSAQLAALQRGNFFIIPLDDKRHWYRYHHLFAEVLRLHLIAEEPDQVPGLHRRASEWYEHNGSPADAIRHALAARDFDRAAGLIERAVPAMRRSRQEVMLLEWLKALPDEVFHRRPVLSGHYGALLLQIGHLDGVEARLRDAEMWLDAIADQGKAAQTIPTERIVQDEVEFRRLPGSIAVHRAGLALAMGDVAATVKYARQALDLVPEEDHLGHGAASALLGLVLWTNGDLEAARRAYVDSMAKLLKAGHTSDVLGCSIALADMHLGQGHLREAMRTFERGLQLGMEPGNPALAVRGTADMHVGLSEIYRERDELDTATQHLLRSQELGQFKELAQNPYRWRAAMARIRVAQGNLEDAIDLLNEAERLYYGDFSPNVRPIAAMRARVWVAQGRLGDAFDWARAQDLSAADDLSYLHEFEHITLARMLMEKSANGRSDQSLLEALGLLERLLKAAQEGGRMGSVIEILILQALAHQSQGDIHAALIPLHQALTLAEPEGYVRMFLDEGPPMKELLLEAAADGITPDYTGKLLEGIHFGQQSVLPVLPALEAQLVQRAKSVARQGGSVEQSSHLSTPASQSQYEPLSQRELEILHLFKTELSGPEIAAELVIALSTVRTHTKSIYSKLNVNNRRAAVKRASELGLME